MKKAHNCESDVIKINMIITKYFWDFLTLCCSKNFHSCMFLITNSMVLNCSLMPNFYLWQIYGSPEQKISRHLSHDWSIW